jgi:hypothetical protein
VIFSQLMAKPSSSYLSSHPINLFCCKNTDPPPALPRVRLRLMAVACGPGPSGLAALSSVGQHARTSEHLRAGEFNRGPLGGRGLPSGLEPPVKDWFSSMSVRHDHPI